MSPNDQIIDDKEVAVAATDSYSALADSMRDTIFRTRQDLRRQSHASAMTLKGFYLDFVFSRLNLTQYR